MSRIRPCFHPVTSCCLMMLTLIVTGFVAPLAQARSEPPYCGTEGVWLQILGSGGPELNDKSASASYLVWLNDEAKLLVDTGPGASVRFDEAGARFEDLDAIVYTHLHVDHSNDFPAFIKGSYFAERKRPLPVLGPTGNDLLPSMRIFVERMIGPEGAYPYLKDFLTYKSSGGYKVVPKNVPSTGRRRWARFGTQNLKLSSIPVHHGPIPAIAWRVEIGGVAITFSGDFNNDKDTLTEFAKGSRVLVVSHAIPENARGAARDLHAPPSVLGKIAQQAGVDTLVLGHRMNRTRGRESQTREAIETYYKGSLIFADDLECWGF